MTVPPAFNKPKKVQQTKIIYTMVQYCSMVHHYVLIVFFKFHWKYNIVALT